MKVVLLQDVKAQGKKDQVVEVSFGPDGKLNGNPKMCREDIFRCFLLAL